jgi:hypothetical protein
MTDAGLFFDLLVPGIALKRVRSQFGKSGLRMYDVIR